MSAKSFIDTNILLYAVDKSPDHPEKTSTARQLLTELDWAWSVQVAQEFYVNATSPRKGIALSHDDASAYIKTWMAFPMATNDGATLLEALEIKKRVQLSFWDANIVAAARQLGCSQVPTEDLNSGQDIAGIRIQNPFRI